MRQAIYFAAIVAASLLLATQAVSQGMLEYSACMDSYHNPGLGSNAAQDGRIFACSRIIADTALPSETRAKAYRQRGYIRFYRIGKGDRTPAVADLTEAIRFDPQKREYYQDRARIQLGLVNGIEPSTADAERAVRGLDEAIRQHPKVADLYDERATAFLYMKDYDRGFSDVKAVLRLTTDASEHARNVGKYASSAK